MLTARAEFPVTDATSTLKGSSLHVYVKEKEWRVANNGKKSETELRDYLARTVLGV